MTLEYKLEARQIVFKAGMSDRPEYYSGRGAITDDLTGQKLEKIYESIKHYHGNDAAQNFAQMVADIPVLSATDFLHTLYTLEGNAWHWDKRSLGNEKGIDVGPDFGDGGREAIGTATICARLTSHRNETGTIRNRFLRNHSIEVPPGENSGEYSF